MVLGLEIPAGGVVVSCVMVFDTDRMTGSIIDRDLQSKPQERPSRHAGVEGGSEISRSAVVLTSAADEPHVGEMVAVGLNSALPRACVRSRITLVWVDGA